MLAFDVDPQLAREAIASVPSWFHTFCLNAEHGIYTPGLSGYNYHDRYRPLVIPSDLTGKRVLDLGTYDGFYAFLAERRGAAEVLAIDNEAYVDWRATEGLELIGGAALRTIRDLTDSQINYRVMEVEDLEKLGGGFNLIFCFGLLHWLRSPLDHLAALRRSLLEGGQVLLETYGQAGNDEPLMRVAEGGRGYAGSFYWEFTFAALRMLAKRAGFSELEELDHQTFNGHPRLLARITA